MYEPPRAYPYVVEYKLYNRFKLRDIEMRLCADGGVGELVDRLTDNDGTNIKTIFKIKKDLWAVDCHDNICVGQRPYKVKKVITDDGGVMYEPIK